MKALVHFVPRLNAKTFENKVLKLLLKTMHDPEASIRTNAVICCGMISSSLPPALATQMLTSALPTGLKDPFSPCRSASLQTLQATAALFPLDDLANRLMPCVCQRLADPDANVHNTAFDVLESLRHQMREKVDERTAQQSADAAANIGGSNEAQSAAQATGGWSSWALSTVGSVVTSKLAGSMSSSAPGAASAEVSTPTHASASTPTHATSGMDLSRKSLPQPTVTEEEGGGAGWGLDDLGLDNELIGAGEEPDNFWEDFGQMPTQVSSLAEQQEAEAARKVEIQQKRPSGNRVQPPNMDASVHTPASRQPKAAPKAKSQAPAAKKPSSADMLAKEEDDFWAEFNM